MKAQVKTQLKTGSLPGSRHLNGHSSPLFRRIENDLRTRISGGEWKVGAMIHGRQRLSEEYGVHIQTIEKAIKALVEDGTLDTQGTRGTFVANPATSLGAVQNERVGEERWGDKLSRRRTVGIVCTDNPVSQDSEVILRSVEKSLSNVGGSIEYINRTVPGQSEISLSNAVAGLLSRGCEVLVALTYNDWSPQVDEFEAMTGGTVPLIHVSAASINRPIWNVYYDSIDAGYQAATHLIESGCRSFYYLAHEHYQWADERLIGVRAALQRAGVADHCLQTEFIDERNVSDPTYVGAARHRALMFLAREIPQGIVAVNDNVARGIVEAARERGLTPGDDFQLVAFDDSVVARDYAITSLRPPLDEMGQCAARLAVRALENDPTCQRICLSSHLIVRSSTNGRFSGTASPMYMKEALST